MASTASVTSVPRTSFSSSRRLTTLAAAVALLAIATTSEAQLPVAPTVINGNATIATVGNAMTITNSPNAILNWQGFSIGARNSVYFQQQDASSQVLNRVVGNDPSRILGSLASNGRVWLVNPHGVLFGQNARIDVAGLVATSLNISNADFLGGRYAFARPDSLPAAGVLNQGEIRTSFGGRVWLIGDSVRNEGVVETPGGRIVLAAGRSLELVDSGLPNLVVRVSAAESAAINLGSLLASDGGKVDVYGSIVNQQGIIRADSLGVDAAGMITLRAQDELTLGDGSQTSASALGSGSGGMVVAQSESGTTLLSGEISATSAEGKGGKIHLLGENVGVFRQASVDASGATGGGEVLVGGDYQGGNPAIDNATATYLGSTAQLKANATASGDGGRVIVWSENATRAFGRIEAKGGPLGGDGGLIETSGKFLDTAGIRVSAGATKGSPGRWLLDPSDIYIMSAQAQCGSGEFTASCTTVNVVNTGTESAPVFEASGTPAVVLDSDISAALNSSTNVTIRTGFDPGDGSEEGGDLFVWSDFDNQPGIAASIVYEGTEPAQLTLEAYRHIHMEAGTSIRSTGIEAPSAPLTVSLIANKGGSGVGRIIMHSGSAIVTQGGNINLGGGVSGAAVGGPGEPGIEIDNGTLDAGSSGTISLKGTGPSVGGDGVLIGGNSRLSAETISIHGSTTSRGKLGIELAGDSNVSGRSILIESLNGSVRISDDSQIVADRGVITVATGIFDNRAGASALSAPDGRWLIYAGAPSKNTLDGLPYDFVQYDAPYPTPPAQSGNGILYATPGDEVKPQADPSQFINSLNVAVNLATSYGTALGSGSLIDTLGSAIPMGFGRVDIGSMSMDQLSRFLEERQEFKRKLFADAIFRLKLDPSLADVRPCLTQADVATGLCRVTEAQIGAMAKTSGLGLWKQRKVRIAELPRIERKMAIFFGVDDYSDKKIPPLENALADADAMAALFAERMGYEVRVLRNPTKAAIIQTLNQLAIETSDKDSVLIYYAGHGLSLDKDGEGYWIPADGPVDDPSRWVSNRDITKYLAAIRANQITMISDSCYSGAFAREGRVLVAADLKPDEVLQKRSVVVVSSGGDEPVADAGREGHSIFAWYLLDTLARVQNWQPGNTVFSTVQSEVVHAFPQTPRYGAMTSAGHQQGGDYLFEFRQLEAAEAASPALK
ncbi:caspase family protein [Rhodocyclus purpureus]|uniref:two-partner secretion domain-containing protein n=1 Tax=Rhodocyclus purpureus TaxID=1067 RepID=UPI001911E2AE|nr:caspase family protein [Rhodocyclus purpureus]MBK5915003.1 hypothetical protein [Rhodocyclus purpureus]